MIPEVFIYLLQLLCLDEQDVFRDRKPVNLFKAPKSKVPETIQCYLFVKFLDCYCPFFCSAFSTSFRMSIVVFFVALVFFKKSNTSSNNASISVSSWSI